jgi:hypothetical protein
MRELSALVTVAAIAAPLAIIGCYTVPGLNDGGASGADGAFQGGDAGRDASGSSSGSGSGSSSGSSGGSHDGSIATDAACRGVLCPCNNAQDCASEVCASSMTVGNSLIGAAGGANFCTQGCCTSSDCPSGTVCYATGEGGQYCVDPTWVGRSKPATGATFMGGSACSTGSMCNSGLCANSACADTCCSFASSSNECASPTSCVFGVFPGKQGIDTHFAPHCGTAGTSGYGATCTADGECQGGLCFQSGTGGNCIMPCRSQQECGSGSGCQWDVHGNDMYVACYLLPPTQMGNGDVGATCGSDPYCLSDYCNTTNLCTGPCFTNSDCTAHLSGWHCTPYLYLTPPQGNYYALGCGP